MSNRKAELVVESELELAVFAGDPYERAMKSYQLVVGLMALNVVGAVGAEKPLFQWPTHYIAIMETTTGEDKVETKMSVDGTRIRSETTVSGQQMISIQLAEQKKVITLMPAQKMAMVMVLPEAAAAPLAAPDSEATWENLGSEEMEGKACDKFKVTTSNGALLYWIDSKQKVPVRMQDEKNSLSVVWKSFKKEKPDASVFEVPSDYKVQEFGGMPGLVPGQ